MLAPGQWADVAPRSLFVIAAQRGMSYLLCLFLILVIIKAILFDKKILIILHYICALSSFCTSSTYIVLYVNYILIKLGEKN